VKHTKVIVTGGAGFIGSYLVQILISKGFDVTIYDDFSNGSGKLNLPTKAKIVRGSILNYNRMKTVFKKSKLVFNLAVLPLPMSFIAPGKIVKVNDYGTFLVSKVCSEFKIKLVHVSSSEAYGTAKYSSMKEDHPLFPTTIYAASKAASEAYVRAFEQSDNLKFVIVRPFNAYGEFMREDTYSAAIPKFFARISKNKNPIIFGSGNQTRDLTHAEDIAKGIFLAGVKEGGCVLDGGLGTISLSGINEAKKRKISLQKIDIRMGFLSNALLMINTEKLLGKIYGEKRVENFHIVAGGFIGKKGDVVVDSITNTKEVIGIANGEGGLSKSSHFRKNVKLVKKLVDN